MQQPPSGPYNDGILAINARIDGLARQLERMQERMEARTDNLATRSDLDALREQLVARDTLNLQLDPIRKEIDRVDKRINQIEADQIGKQQMLWMKIGPVIGILAFTISLLQFLMHVKLTP